MSNIPADLRYVASHEWIRLEADGSVTVGITDHAGKPWVTWSTSSCRKSASSWPAARKPVWSSR